jgi:hypothetical protein
MGSRSFARRHRILAIALAACFWPAPSALAAQVTGSERTTFTQSVWGTGIPQWTNALDLTGRNGYPASPVPFYRRLERAIEQGLKRAVARLP